MKKFIILAVLLFARTAIAGSIDTINVTSAITDVTVFFNGAQITRTADLKLNKGQYLLRFDQLPFEVNPQSIQVTGIAHCEILSVKHLVNYYNTSVKSNEEVVIQQQIDAQELMIKDIGNQLAVFDLESRLLLENSDLEKKDNGTAITDIKDAADFYRARLNEILAKKLNLTTKLKGINDSIQSLYTRLNEVNSKKKMVYSQILVLVECSEKIAAPLHLSYYIASAGWVPLYDFRVDEITHPLSIVYNASVYQSTGEDWKNINIRLSTNNPSLSGNKPDLLTWKLGQQDPYQRIAVKEGVSGIRGRVYDSKSEEPIMFANVVVMQGTTLISGATTDVNGQYMIKPVPSGTYTIEVSYIGYGKQLVPNVWLAADQITNKDILMESNVVALESVAIYADRSFEPTSVISADVYHIDGVAVRSGSINARNNQNNYYYRGSRSENLKTTAGIVSIKVNDVMSPNYISNSLKSSLSNLEYVIDVPYTVPSDGEDYLIKIKDTNVIVSYAYHTVPKLDQDAFLIAEVYDWTSLNLLSGKTSIYYQGTFTGESFIDANNTSDTLRISLGRDKNLIVQRQGKKETYDKRAIGNTIKETVGFDITIKNNKQCQVRIVVEDQHPISERKSIEVLLMESGDAQADEKTGKLTWEFTLQPGEKKVLTYKYSVKYPKDANLNLD